MPQIDTKRRRITKACDFCHRRGRKCKTLQESSSGISEQDAPATCLTCLEHGVPCTWDRVSVKRGVKSKTELAFAERGGSLWKYDEVRHGSRDVIHALLLVFFDTVYPIFPFFNEDDVLLQWEETNLSTSRAEFSRLMAICALSSCHVKNGAVLSSLPPSLEGFKESKTFFEDAQSAVPAIIDGPDTFGHLQSIATLVLIAIQIGDVALLHRFLGLYHTLTAQHTFHDESRWPPTLPLSERETRRRLFWSMYRIEVHSALVMGHAIRCPEMQAGVSYPSMPDISSVFDPGVEDNSIDIWLVGWNYVTDLYRVLEHVIIRFRSKRMRTPSCGDLFESTSLLLPSIDSLLSKITHKKMHLPGFLTQALTPSGHVTENRCGFQVANIVCTMQLLKTLSFACEEITFADACTAAQQLIEEFSAIPTAYTRSIGSPMRQELAGVGHLLSSFIGKPLLFTEYQQLRSVILSMATFLESQSASSPTASVAGLHLSQHIDRIDAYIQGAYEGQLSARMNTVEYSPRDYEAGLATQAFQLPVVGCGLDVVVPLEYLQDIPWPGMIDLDMNWSSIGLDDLED